MNPFLVLVLILHRILNINLVVGHLAAYQSYPEDVVVVIVEVLEVEGQGNQSHGVSKTQPDPKAEVALCAFLFPDQYAEFGLDRRLLPVSILE